MSERRDDEDSPETAPLGSTPILPPPPHSAASQRAAALFAKYVTADEPTQVQAPQAPPKPATFASGRRYDLALAAAGVGMPSAPVVSPSVPAPAEPLDRPPPGAPTIRPSARRPAGPEAVSQEVLESTADNVLLVSHPDGGTSFEITIRDEVFADLACRLDVNDGRVLATFRATDVNTRRLLQAEAGRLRARLEERGLTVDDVRVLDGSE